MIHAVELDSQTSSFVRQLEEQRRIEKNLMVERVRGSKEGLDRLESVDLRRDGRFVRRSDHGVR
jgi:uncharacterized tellurite resistance protein B-like protein